MPRPRFQRADPALQQAILDAAVRELGEHGYEGASLNRILLAAGLSKSDYKTYVKTTTGNPVSTLGDDELAVVPASLSAASAAKCYIVYKAAASTPPTVTITGTADDCN